MPRVMLAGERCELTTRTSIKAFYAQDFVVIVAHGDLPKAGDRADIVDVGTSTREPQFALMRCFGFGFSPTVKVPFVHKEVFALPRPEHVVVQHAEGEDRVAVLDAGADLAAFVNSVPSHGSLGHDVESTGYSRAMSFDEAFADALSRLPAVRKDEAGGTQRVTVVDTGALLGDGFSHLYVKVRRERD